MNEEKLDFKEVLISGFALFAIFFGAGNLIIPPKLGLSVGSDWFISSLAFNLSDSFLILIGILSMAKRDANLQEFGGKVSPNFGVILGALTIFFIGPIFSIPRNAATTFETSILPFLPNFPRVLFSVIFFTLVVFLAINASKVIDLVGKYLTPILMVVLALIIITALLDKSDQIYTGPRNKPFITGFIEGYQTMDSLAPIFLTSVILNSFKAKGIKSDKNLREACIKSGLIAIIGLFLVYTCLCYIGSRSYSYVDFDLGRTELLVAICYKLLGSFGKISISLVVGFACLTTAVGILSAFASNFYIVFKEKVPYRLLIIAGAIVACILSVLGVEKIMQYAVPVLVMLYPMVISMYILNLIDNGNISSLTYKITVILVFLASLGDVLLALGLDNNFYVNIFNKIPLATQGFAFVTMFAIGMVLGLLIKIISKRKKEQGSLS